MWAWFNEIDGLNMLICWYYEVWLDQFHDMVIGSKFAIPLGLAEYGTYPRLLENFVLMIIGWLETYGKCWFVIRLDWKMKSD